METINRFSLLEFFTYLFSGAVALSGVVIFFSFQPFDLWNQIIGLLIDLPWSWIFILALSFFIGMLLSAISDTLLRPRRREENKGAIPVEGFENEIEAALYSLINPKKISNDGWSPSNYYICRSLVIHYMPQAFDVARQQSLLRQIRTNLIPAIIIVLLAILRLIYYFLYFSPSTPGVLVSITIFLILGVLAFELKPAMDRHERREVREVLTAFLGGYKTGVFNNLEHKDAGNMDYEIYEI